MTDLSWNNHLVLTREKIRQGLIEQDAAALIATLPGNVRYLTGYWSFMHPLHISFQCYVVITREGKCILVIPRVELDFAAMQSTSVDEIYTFGTFFLAEQSDHSNLTQEEQKLVKFHNSCSNIKDRVEALAGVIKAEGIEKSKLLVDQGHLTTGDWRALQGLMPQAELVEAMVWMYRQRKIKTPYEVEMLRKSSVCTEAAILASLQAVHAGATDVDLFKAYEKSLIENGAEHLFTAIGAGSRSSFPNVQPAAKRLEAGDILRYDVGCRFQGYASDLARNACVGKPAEKVRRYYDAVLAGEEAGIEKMKPGVRACDVYETIMAAIHSSGIPHFRRHHCGHAIGLDIYETPAITPTDDTVLLPGMVFCVETPYYEPGFGGIQVEDMVVITEDGVELLTALDRGLFETDFSSSRVVEAIL